MSALSTLVLMNIIFVSGYYLEYDVDELTENLFQNLRADPVLLDDSAFSENSKAFIDRHVTNYLNLVMEAEDPEYSRSKRSLLENETFEENYFVDIKPFINIPTTSPADIVLFQQGFMWYAACLENEPNGPFTQKIKIKKMQNDSFKEVASRGVSNGVGVAAYSLETFTIITVAENSSARRQFEHQTSIMQFNAEEELEVIQKINTSYTSHVEIWEQEESIYMAVAQFMKEDTLGTRFEAYTPIYKWKGRHFDLIQFIGTSGVLKVSHFSVDGVHFLAVANSKSDNKDAETYSDIFKYDVEKEGFQQFQRIRTHGCRDIKAFRVPVEGEEEHFLVAANTGQEVNYEVPSIIYKYVDDYFIPFQSLKIKDLVGLEPVTVKGGEVVLFAATFAGIKCFHYNGWHFVESQIESKDEATSGAIKAMHFYEYRDKSVVVIVKEQNKENSVNVFKIDFAPRNDLKTVYKEMFMWCLDKKKSIEGIDEIDILEASPRGDISVASQNKSENLEDKKMTELIESYMKEIDEIEDKLLQLFEMEDKDVEIIDRNIKANKLILNNDASVTSMQTDSINGLGTDLFENVLDIDEGFEADLMDFSFLSLEDRILPQTINNFPIDHILHKRELVNIDNLIVDGDIEFLSALTVKGRINNITISQNNTLLNNTEQIFENFTAGNIEIRDLKTEVFNFTNSPVQGGENTNKLKDLRVKNLTVEGYINNVDLLTLQKYALKINGSQKISKKYCFHKIDANNLDTNTLSNKKVLDDFVDITPGKRRVNKDVKFAQNLIVNNLTALKSLDSIPVSKGKLDILQKESSERQYVTGLKSFENLELLNPIQIRGKIRSKVFDTMNPRVTVTANLDLKDDVRITGGVTVEEIVKTNDVVTADGALRRVRQQGLKLTDTEIPIHLNFAQHINVDGVFAERINNIDPSTWVVNGVKQAQIIRGRKQFRGDLEITGDTEVLRMNGIDMVELEKNALRLNGDQVVSGKHYVERVVAGKGIKSGSTKFGSRNLKNITDENETVNTTMAFNNLICNTLKTNNLNINGFVNDLNISELLQDVATADTAFKIFSHKTIKSLTVEHLKAKNDFDLINQSKGLEQYNIKLTGDMYLDNEVSINNIYFTDTCNRVEKNNFIVSKYENGSYIINGNQEFDVIKVFGKVFVDSNIINEENLTDFELNTVKVDEPFDFETVTFKEIIVNSSDIELGGHIEYLDLDNVFQNNNEDLQSIIDEKIFDESLVVEGNVTFEGSLNGFNISELCGFMSDSVDPRDLIIQGDAYFAKGPQVLQFNGLDVKILEEEIWFKDRPITSNGYIKFKNVIFKNNLTVSEQVNGFNLDLIKDNYFSKTKNQTVIANMEFLDQVLFLENISTPSLNLNGEVNEINMESFVKTVLLNDDQLFESVVYLENCRIADVQGQYLVNDLNFDNEVMRYDRKNIISGRKKFNDLHIANLLVSTNLTVKDVDVLQWIKNGVFRNGTHKISGNKQFQNVTLSNGLSLEGLLNGRHFDKHAVMLKDASQTVTGRKIFMADTVEGVTFKALKITGLVNDVDVAELAHNQVFKTGDNVFKSDVHFYGNITTKNVVVKDLYQGINVTELLKNISTLGVLNNFENNYKSLHEMITEVENSLRGQAYFLHYYKSVSHFSHVLKIFGRKSIEGKCQIMVVYLESQLSVLRFFDWNEELNAFQNKAGYSVVLGPVPNYLDQIVLGETDYIYMEHAVDPITNGGYNFLGKLIHFKALPNTTEFKNSFFRTNGTIFTTSFELEIRLEYCLLFITYEEDIHVTCINRDGELYLLQAIPERSRQASVVNVDGLSYLVTIKTATQTEEPRTSIWRFDNETSRFELYRTIYEGNPISLTTVSYNSGCYVAVAYGHVQNTMHLGRVVIRRYDKKTQEFESWQNIHLGTPTHLEFSILPSEELVLYILTENPSEPLIVYVYEGISGFIKKIVGSAIPNAISMNQFSINNKHFVVTRHFNYLNIIQAIFKGERLN